jgi:CPA1 family monovalent cation:H+ antiporter
VLCATPNDFYNALVCNALGAEFGRHRTLQLPTSEDGRSESRRLTADQRGHFAFSDDADHDWLHARLDDGWAVRKTRLSEDHDLSSLTDRLGEPGEDWLLLGAIRPGGRPKLYSTELPFEPEPDWVVLFFAPPDDQSTADDETAETSRNDTDKSSDTSTS